MLIVPSFTWASSAWRSSLARLEFLAAVLPLSSPCKIDGKAWIDVTSDLTAVPKV
jgi:hypothetical protein